VRRFVIPIHPIERIDRSGDRSLLTAASEAIYDRHHYAAESFRDEHVHLLLYIRVLWRGEAADLRPFN
jgi:hypothetical protein